MTSDPFEFCIYALNISDLQYLLFISHFTNCTDTKYCFSKCFQHEATKRSSVNGTSSCLSVNQLVRMTWLLLLCFVNQFLGHPNIFNKTFSWLGESMKLKFYWLFIDFQDGLEFSPPRIHSPYYHIDDTCNPYAKDDKLFLETFQKHYNYPSSSRAGATGSAPAPPMSQMSVLLTSVIIVCCRLQQNL